MEKIKALLVDDEQKAINNLTILLDEFCKNVQVIGTARSVDEAVSLIEHQKPDVVFLDIEMPEKSGFDLFKETNEQFQTIFVTAYNEYAVKAFEVSAVDYLLKPVNINRLQQAVNKIQKKQFGNIANIKSLHENLSTNKLKQISVPYKDVYKNLIIDNIVCIEAKTAYSKIYYSKNNQIKEFLYSKNLTYFEKILADNTIFFRTHRSWIVNGNEVQHFSKKELTVTIGGFTIPISRRKATDFFQFLKLHSRN